MQPIRIAIVGTSASGKTTLAKALAAKFGITHIELDQLYWKPDWTPTPMNEFAGMIEAAVNKNKSWVVCGNYNKIKEITLPLATHIIWLNYPLHVNLWRGFKRSVQRAIKQEEIFDGCRESFYRTFLTKESILHWILITHARRKKEFSSLLTSENFPEAQLFVISDKSDYKQLLKMISAGRFSTSKT